MTMSPDCSVFIALHAELLRVFGSSPTSFTLDAERVPADHGRPAVYQIMSMEAHDTDGHLVEPLYAVLLTSGLPIHYDDLGAEIIVDGLSTPMNSETSYKSALCADRIRGLVMALLSDPVGTALRTALEQTAPGEGRFTFRLTPPPTRVLH